MFQVHDVIFIVLLSTIVSGLIIYIWLTNHKLSPNKKLQAQVDALVTKIGEMQLKSEGDRRELLEVKALNAAIQANLIEANATIEHLKQLLGEQRGPDESLLPKLLAIFGDDPVIAERDKRGLREAGVDYEAVNDATREKIQDEVNARREDRRPLKLLHVGSHGSEHGIALVGENGQTDWAEPDWWRDTFGNVQVVMLSVCNGTSVANELAHMTDYLIYFRDGVDNNDAAAFTGTFWQDVECGLEVRSAYHHARRQVPGVRDFVSLRFRRGDF